MGKGFLKHFITEDFADSVQLMLSQGLQGQDITELRSESKMLANYVRICGAAVWSLRGNAMTGVVTDSKTKEIEHLISQQAQMDVCDPRMVLWRASFIAILKTMCQDFWVRRKESSSSSAPS